MTIWRGLALLGFGVAAIAGGTAGALGAAWLLSRIARRWGLDPTPMGRTIQTYPAVSLQEADAIRADADQRRTDADDRHAEAHAIETGDGAVSHASRMTDADDPARLTMTLADERGPGPSRVM